MDIRKLREITGVKQADLAETLSVSQKTISNMEKLPDKNLSPFDKKNLIAYFLPLVLEHILFNMSKILCAKIYSEVTSIYLVHTEKCFTIPGTTYLYFSPKVRVESYASSLNIVSLTTHPLRTGKILNLSGENILKHPSKKYPGRGSPLLKDNICESMLKIPVLTQSSTGPQPILLLTLENKLENTDADQNDSGNQEIIEDIIEKEIKTKTREYLEINDKVKVVKDISSPSLNIFSNSDVETAIRLSSIFARILVPYLSLLGMAEIEVDDLIFPSLS